MTNRDDDRDMRYRDDMGGREGYGMGGRDGSVDRDRSRYGRDMSPYGPREEDRDRPMGGRDRSFGQYGAERDMRDTEDRSGMDRGYGGQRNDRSYDMNREQGREQGAGNSYQRGLGGVGSSNPERAYGDSNRGGMGMGRRNRDFDQYDSGYGVYGNRDQGSSMGSGTSTYGDRDMGNLERDRYGLGSAMRGGGMQGSMGMDRGYGGMRQGSMGQGPMGQHYGRGPKNYQRSDDRIREDVSEQLTYHHDIDATDIDVQVQGGEVTLTGTVTDRRQKRMAEDIAEEVRGVRDVHNQIRVQGGLGGSGMQGGAMVVTPSDTGQVVRDGGTPGASGSMGGQATGGSPLSTTAMSGGDSTNMTTPGTTTSSTPGASEDGEVNITPIHSLNSDSDNDR